MSRAFVLEGQSNAFPRTDILWRLEPRGGESFEVLWDARDDPENTWYRITFSEPWASWLNPVREPERVMHRVSPSEYLVIEGEQYGFDPAVLPELPLDTESADELD